MDNFDPKEDYFKLLNDDEKFNGERPLLKGLWRLAHTYRGGIHLTSTRVITSPTEKDKVAVVEYTVVFKDGTSFSGAADATTIAHKAPYNLHLVAVAETKAEARALRRAFNITKASADEVGSAEISDKIEEVPITDAQIDGIRLVAKRKQIGKKAILDKFGPELADITDLTKSQGIEVMKWLNKIIVKDTPISVEIKEVTNE